MSAALDAPLCLSASSTFKPRHCPVYPESWDVHAHVIDGSSAHPFVTGRHYTPPPANPENHIAMLDAIGFQYGVLIQISVHGTDNGPILNALRKNPARLRGVGAIDGTESDSDLETLRDFGVCGVRVNELFAGSSGVATLRRIAERSKELGWHLDLALHGHRLRELAPMLKTLDLPLVIDHMGWCFAKDGVNHPDFQSVLELASMGNCWTKLSGAYRISGESFPYYDAAPFTRALLRVAPNRTVWGSDWPHVAIFDQRNMPEPGALLDSLWAHLEHDAELLRALLVNNPLRLYGRPNTPVRPPSHD